MSPRRRSSRLRGSSTTPAKSINYASNRLSSLAERDETPTCGTQSNLDAIVSSPVAPRTPATAGRVKPGLEEMHPSKVHHSTTKKPDSGLRLGFTDIDAHGNDQPSGVAQQTPSKTSPSFEFYFARPAPQLGPEAQRMMDELREDALRIKSKLAAEREEEKRKAGGEAASHVGGRKIAHPKGRVGRFSDVHMAEFKKMDSIAGHASAFRAQPGRLTPATNSLKRSQSNAKLDDREDSSSQVHEASKKSSQTERLENTAPAKRARQHINDDTSSARPVSRDSQTVRSMPPTPTLARSQSSMLASITAPTQASLGRATSVKHPSTQIPTLSKSPPKTSLGGTPSGLTKSATSNNISNLTRSESKSFLRSPNKLDRIKSILRHPSASSKKGAPTIPSSTPSLTRSASKPNLDKALPSAPTTPVGLGRSKSAKHVNFTPDTVTKHAATAQNSPSPVKSGIPRSASKMNIGGVVNQPNERRSSAREVKYPSFVDHSGGGWGPTVVEYPSLSEPRPFPEPLRHARAQPPPQSVPGTFAFRSDKTISFGASPNGFGSSPGQASVRQVRQSVFPSTMPGSFPSGNKENIETLPSVPHGMSNKKRRRVDSDDDTEEEAERSPKKHKGRVAEGAVLMAPKIQAEKTAPKTKIPSPAKKSVLSLSRLNMLARPKMRK